MLRMYEIKISTLTSFSGLNLSSGGNPKSLAAGSMPHTRRLGWMYPWRNQVHMLAEVKGPCSRPWSSM